MSLRKSEIRSQKSGEKSHTPEPGVASRSLKPMDNETRTQDSILAMKLIGSNPPASIAGVDELPGKTNYFIGNNPGKWRTNIANYAEVRYAGVYPGVDLVYYGHQGQLEYDFAVAPGADPKAIRLALDGRNSVASPDSSLLRGSSLRLATNGDLVMRIAGGEVRFHKPVVYQPADSNTGTGRLAVECHYRLTGRRQVMFEVASYDRARPLIIDPTLSYSTYLGGTGDDEGTAVAVDAGGNAYVTGLTASVDFPITAGAFQTTYANNTDAFVSKLDPTGSVLVYSTYLGGSNSDFGESIAVGISGQAFVAGQTASTDFPATPGAFQTKCAGTCGTKTPDAFVTELNPTGSALVYSTYLGGTGFDQANGIALDSGGDAYVVGWTASTDFPTTPHAAQTGMAAEITMPSSPS